MVHFVIEENDQIRPLCGEWGDDRSWTKIRSAVSCPRCLALLQDDHEAPHAGAPPAGHLVAVVEPDPSAGA